MAEVKVGVRHESAGPGNSYPPIIQYMRRTHNLLIGERTAEQVKCDLGSATPLEKPLTMEVKGRHLLDGVPRTIVITDGEVRQAICEPLKLMIQAVCDALERVPPELSADIYDRGVVLTGGGALSGRKRSQVRSAAAPLEAITTS
jgi:rod shape-determining protein MreB and related proteins